MEIYIRAAEMDDVPALKELIPLSARERSKGFYTLQQTESAIQYIFGVDTQLIADKTYYIAEAENQIVRCGGWSKRKTLYGGDQMKTEEDPLLDPKVDAGHIRAFFIHPEWARKASVGESSKPAKEPPKPMDLQAWNWARLCQASHSMPPWEMK